ncbi:hypothetical protein LIER_13433 [Lithospermum erythrorhizon]|uniref:RING-type domain-containing protein n=1 Tax=Lithospermum erythrorhizon TaxID=34254 RepID=A0AAV3PVE5_LITER
MGLQNQLTDVSSESIPIIIISIIAKWACYIRSLFFDIFHFILSPNHLHQMHDAHAYDVVGSGLANVVVLAEQLNLNRVLSHSFHDKGDPYSKCVVCLIHFGGGDHVRILACQHVFHKDCFDGWLHCLNFNCPLCRASLVSDESVELTRRRFEEGIALEECEVLMKYTTVVSNTPRVIMALVQPEKLPSPRSDQGNIIR